MLEARAAVKGLRAYRPPLAGRQGLRLDFNESTVGCHGYMRWMRKLWHVIRNVSQSKPTSPVF